MVFRQKMSLWVSLLALALPVLWSGPAMAEGQIPLLNGIKLAFKSKVLKEERALWIRLPKSYDNANIEPASYPVVYLLDAESNFTYFAGLIDRLSSGPYAAMPEMIVVGIVNTNRTRDLTPTSAKASMLPGRSAESMTQQSGGNARFFAFLEKEVMPAVAANFRTDDYRVLVGHSFGGLTALNALLNHNELFHAYIVHDPSIWWDDQIMLQQYQQAKSFDFKQRKLYLSYVDEPEQGGQSDHYNGIKAFEELLRQTPFKGLSFKHQPFQNEDHGTIPIVGNHYGLRYLFEGHRINIKAIAKEPDLVGRSYARLSQTLGHTFKPSELYLDRVGQYLLGLGETTQAREYLQQNLTAHPKSPQANHSMADYFEKVKETAQAKQYRARAQALGYKVVAK